MPDDPALYVDDLYEWTERQAALLRRRAAGDLANDAELDWLNLAEEIESLGAHEKREVRSRLTLILQHLLKWRYQPEMRSRSWKSTISVQRRDLLRVFEDSPSLRRFAAGVLPDCFCTVARRRRRKLACSLCLTSALGPWSRCCRPSSCRTDFRHAAPRTRLLGR